MKIDKKDKQILMALQENCRLSSRELGRKLGIPATTVHQRIKKLEQNKVIVGYNARIDNEKVGIPTTALVLVRRSPKPDAKVKPGYYSEIASNAAKLPEVQEAHVVTGEYDMVLKVVGKNEKEVGAYVVDSIWNIPGIERTLTLMVFHTSKDTHKVTLV